MDCLFHSVTNFDIRAFSTWDRAFDEQQTALNISANDFEVLDSLARHTIVTGHLLTFEDAAWVLALAC